MIAITIIVKLHMIKVFHLSSNLQSLIHLHAEDRTSKNTPGLFLEDRQSFCMKKYNK